MSVPAHYGIDVAGAYHPGVAPLPMAAVSACEPIARAALHALHQELSAYPKPGLVSPYDSGSHQDMDAATFMRSLFSLRGYFREIAMAGMLGVGFDDLRRLGIQAESRMLKATNGVNTHRGAIFALGLLAAAAGLLAGVNQPLDGPVLGHVVQQHWGEDILRGAPQTPCTHGTIASRQYGVTGARHEAATGFPHLFGTGLPALEQSLARGADFPAAIIQSFFSLMAVLPDTNLLHRGGAEGLSYAQWAARLFLEKGGVHRSGWREHACVIHREFVAHRLSPGGSADLLAASIFVHRLRMQIKPRREH